MELMGAISSSTDGKKRSAGSNLVPMYLQPPEKELTMDEFESFSLHRLQLLKKIEHLKSRGFEGRDCMSKLKKHESSLKDTLESDFTALEKDCFGHFILRLAYCRTEDLRRWFINYESILFKLRMDELAPNQMEEFMSFNGLNFDIVSASEKTRLADKLVVPAGTTASTPLTDLVFYKIPFLQALSLIQNRSVYIEGGFAFVPLSNLVSIIVAKFRMNLSKSLAIAANKFEKTKEDPRIGPMLINMSKHYIGNDFTKSTVTTDKLTPENVESAAELHMPLCMKYLHSGLKREHKLKHWGRLQYGLFLKGAGLDLESTLIFMESHFAKIMSHDQFVKNYSYTFRHMHGKEGQRKNYTPYSCIKIILGTPPEIGAYHGCPYKHMPDSQLNALLLQAKIAGSDAKDIVAIAKEGHYQVACQKHFDVTHPGHEEMKLNNSESVANHPNQWLQTSKQYHRAKSASAVPAPSSSTATPGANDASSVDT